MSKFIVVPPKLSIQKRFLLARYRRSDEFDLTSIKPNPQTFGVWEWNTVWFDRLRREALRYEHWENYINEEDVDSGWKSAEIEHLLALDQQFKNVSVESSDSHLIATGTVIRSNDRKCSPCSGYDCFSIREWGGGESHISGFLIVRKCKE